MHADAQARQIEDEHEPAVRTRLIGTLFPFQDEPEDESGEHGTIGIHLALYGREPKGVTPGVGQGGSHTARHDDEQLPAWNLGGSVIDNQPSHQMRDAPEQEKDAECRQNSRHDVHHVRHLRRVRGKMTEEVSGEHEEGCARRMSHLQTRCRRGKLRAVPEGCRGLNGQTVGDGCHSKDHPSYDVVNDTITLHSLYEL